MLEVSVSNRVLRLELNRPERRNALSFELCQSLVEELARAERDDAIGAVLLTGRGASFCSGMDLKEVRDIDPGHLADVHERLFSAVHRARKPIIAAVQGAAVAGGTGLVANAHIVFATPDAEFGLPEIRIGLWPVLIYRVVAEAIGERRILEWSLTGRRITAHEAREAGLVTAVDEDPLRVAEAAALTVACYSASALREGMSFARESRGLSTRDQAVLAREVRDRMTAHKDFHEGVQAFADKRKPNWNKEP